VGSPVSKIGKGINMIAKFQSLLHPRPFQTYPWKWVVILISFPAAAGMGVLIAGNFVLGLGILLIFGGIAYTLLCFNKPFWAFMLLLFFGLNESLSGVSIIGSISLMVAMGFVFAFVWIAKLATQKATFIAVKEYWPLLGMGSIIIVSSIANWGGTPVLRSILTYFQQFLLVLLMVNFVTTSERLRIVGIVIIISSLSIAIPMLVAQFGGLSPYSIGIGLSTSEANMNRLMGYFGDPNFTCAQLIFALPFVVELWPGIRSRVQRVLMLAAGGMILLASFYTYSVGGLIGLVVYFLLKVMVLNRSNIILRIGVLVLGIATGIFIFFVFFPTPYQAKILANISIVNVYINTGDPAVFSQIGTDRGGAWQAAFRAVEASPLLGYGPGNGANAGVVQEINLALGHATAAHNMFLSVAKDLGLLGFCFFAYLCIVPWLALWPLRGQQQKIPSLLQASRNAVFSAMTICLVMGIGLDLNLIKFPWALIGMAIVTKRLLNSSEKTIGDE
jgi:hypothetical protein